MLCAFLIFFVPFCGYAESIVQSDYSLVAGSLFTPEGRSFGGAKITAIRTDVDEKQQKKSRKETFSDRFGAFAFRLDVGPAKYRLIVEAKGFPKQERDVEISGNERTDISIVLKK